MEAVLKDLSNFSSTTSNLGLQNPGFAAFLIAIAITLVAVIVFNGLIAVVLLRSTPAAVTVRVPLINLLVVILLGTVNLLLGSLTTVVLVLSDPTEPRLPLCQFVLWVYQVTRLARLLGLVVFTLMVFQTVTCGTRIKVQNKVVDDSQLGSNLCISTTHVCSCPLHHLYMKFSM